MGVLSKRMLNWARKKVKEGYYKSEIAEALFVSPTTVQVALKGFNPPKREPLVYNGKTKKERNEFIKTKYYEGYLQIEIAKAVGMQQAVLNQLIKRKRYEKKPKEKLVYDFDAEVNKKNPRYFKMVEISDKEFRRETMEEYEDDAIVTEVNGDIYVAVNDKTEEDIVIPFEFYEKKEENENICCNKVDAVQADDSAEVFHKYMFIPMFGKIELIKVELTAQNRVKLKKKHRGIFEIEIPLKEENESKAYYIAQKLYDRYKFEQEDIDLELPIKE